MPLKDAYSVDELAQRCARDEIEIDRLRAEIERLQKSNKWLAEKLGDEALIVGKLRAALQRIKDNGEQGGYAYGVAFAALQSSNEQLAPDINPYIKPEKRREAIRDMVAEAQKLKLP